jgi:hypothetical protein
MLKACRNVEGASALLHVAAHLLPLAEGAGVGMAAKGGEQAIAPAPTSRRAVVVGAGQEDLRQGAQQGAGTEGGEDLLGHFAGLGRGGAVGLGVHRRFSFLRQEPSWRLNRWPATGRKGGAASRGLPAGGDRTAASYGYSQRGLGRRIEKLSTTSCSISCGSPAALV